MIETIPHAIAFIGACLTGGATAIGITKTIVGNKNNNPKNFNPNDTIRKTQDILKRVEDKGYMTNPEVHTEIGKRQEEYRRLVCVPTMKKIDGIDEKVEKHTQMLTEIKTISLLLAEERKIKIPKISEDNDE